MAIKDALFTFLSTNGGVSALVGNKIFPSFAATGSVKPYIVYERDTIDPVENLVAVSTALTNESFSFECHGQTVAEVEALQAAVVAAMKLLIDTTVLTIDFRRALLESAVDGEIQPGFGEETRLHNVTLIYSIWFR